MKLNWSHHKIIYRILIAILVILVRWSLCITDLVHKLCVEPSQLNKHANSSFTQQLINILSLLEVR